MVKHIVIQFNAPNAEARYAEIARYLDMKGNSDKELTQNLVTRIDELNKRLEIPQNLKDFGVNETEFLEKLSTFSELAVGDA